MIRRLAFAPIISLFALCLMLLPAASTGLAQRPTASGAARPHLRMAAAAAMPTSVTIAGSFQKALGCPGDWQPQCATTHLTYSPTDDAWTGVFTLTAGTYEYKAALNDSWAVSYGKNTGSANIALTLPTTTTVSFFYDDKTHWITDNINAVIATAPGSYQTALGCSGNWQPDCLRSWLEDPTGSGTYSFETTSIPAGTYETKVAINRSWTENYGQGGAPGGANIRFVVPANGTKVTFRYNPATHVLSVTSGHGHDNNVEYDGLAHDSRNSLYRVPFGAVNPTTPVTLRFRTFHNDVTGVTIRLYDTAVGHEDREPMRLAAQNVDCNDAALTAGGNTCDYWQYTYTPTALGTVYYRFIAVDGTATAYYADTANRYGGVGVATPDEQDNGFRLNVVDPAFKVIPWMQNGVMYQIFPDRFRNGNPANDPAPTDKRYDYPAPANATPQQQQAAADAQIQLRAWNQFPEGYCRGYDSPATPCVETPKGRDYFGGDLQGVDQKLGYLKRLGITIIYFNPIFESGSNHGYDTRDYMTISHYFGTNSYFADTLVPDAAGRGIKIVLDGVFNHLSSDSPFFDRYHHFDTVGACESPLSPYRSWFVFHDVPLGQGPCAGSDASHSATYDGWAGFDSIPVIQKKNPTNPSLPYDPVAQYFYRDPMNSVTGSWLHQGAAGWRFDVMTDPSFPASYWQELRTVAKGVTPDAVLIAEAWHWYDALPLTQGDQADTTMGYRFRNAVLGLLGATDDKGFAQENNPALPPSTFAARIMSMREDYADATWYASQNLLDSHDTKRILWSLTPGRDNRQDKELNAANVLTGTMRQRVAALVQMTLPGTPQVYYGDEVGLTGADDPDDRRPFPWTLNADGTYRNTDDTTYDDAAGNHATFDWYRTLTGIRAANPVLRQGKLTFLLTDDANKTLAYATRRGNNLVITVINRNESAAQTISVPTTGYLRDGVSFTDALSSTNTATTAQGALGPVTLGPLGAAIFVMNSGQAITGPAAPADLTATAQNGVTSTVTLTWSASAAATSYNVYRSPVQGGGYVKIGTAATTTFSDTTVANGTTYYYIVRGVDALGNEGDASPEASATPAFPIGYAVLQYPKTISQTITSTATTVYGQVYIHGLTDAAGDPGAIMAQVGFGPHGSTDYGTWAWQPMSYNAGHTGDNNYEYAGRIRADAPGTYDYLVRFSDDGGHTWFYGDQDGYVPGSNPGTDDPGIMAITPSADTTAPTSPALAIDYSASSLMLTWTASTDPDDAVAEYRIFRGTTAGGEGSTPIATVSGTTTSYTDTTVSAGQTYYYVVTAYDTSLNASAPSNEVSHRVEAKIVRVTFRVSVPAFTPPGDVVYVSGSPDPLCNYCGGTASTALRETAPGSHVWETTIGIPDGTPIQYKYTRGTYDYVEEWGSIKGFTNRVATVHAASPTNLTETFDDTSTTTADDNHRAVQNWRDALVTATSPADDAAATATTAISVTFNWDVKPEGTGSTGDFSNTIAVSQGTTPISGTVIHDAATQSLVFTPAAPLAGGTYTVTVDHIVPLTPQNDGIKIRTPYTFSFVVPGAATATATVPPSSTPTATGVAANTATPVPPTATATSTSAATPTPTIPAATSTSTSGSVPTAAATGTPVATPTEGKEPTETPLPTRTVTPEATARPEETETPKTLPAVEVHNKPRTVRGGRATPCDLKKGPQRLGAGCEIISSISAPRARVVTTIVYPGPGNLRQTFRDVADGRGHALHIFNVPYLPPWHSKHGSPLTVAQVGVTATLPDGRVLPAGSTRFVVVR